MTRPNEQREPGVPAVDNADLCALCRKPLRVAAQSIGGHACFYYRDLAGSVITLDHGDDEALTQHLLMFGTETNRSPVEFAEAMCRMMHAFGLSAEEALRGFAQMERKKPPTP